MNFKSPFYVIEEFISPLMCEEIVDTCAFNVPDTDVNGFPIKTTRTSELCENLLYERLQLALPDLEQYYQLVYRGTERIMFEWYPTGSKGQFVCENSEFLRQKWLRTRARDLTAVLFFSDYQQNVPFDSEFEVYGGKLEFVQHKFGFNPQRGTLIVFPSDPHFINVTTSIAYGDLYQARIQISATVPYIYNPTSFPGDYTKWFAPLVSNT